MLRRQTGRKWHDNYNDLKITGLAAIQTRLLFIIIIIIIILLYYYIIIFIIKITGLAAIRTRLFDLENLS